MGGASNSVYWGDQKCPWMMTKLKILSKDLKHLSKISFKKNCPATHFLKKNGNENAQHPKSSLHPALLYSVRICKIVFDRFFENFNFRSQRIVH